MSSSASRTTAEFLNCVASLAPRRHPDDVLTGFPKFFISRDVYLIALFFSNLLTCAAHHFPYFYMSTLTLRVSTSFNLALFRRFCQIAKSEYWFLRISLSLRPHGTTWLPLEGFSCNLILGNCKNLSIKIKVYIYIYIYIYLYIHLYTFV